ncbi:MAG TPA: flagellar biosynthesis repressor FlbT [Candidatus Sulfotelmatobacter sp.]|nr:flagellar biosynthesis repressor FlbT [Candidatus Sulfotelmatobacter sp.]
MPLAINLRPNERLIVNGVVIQNSTAAAKLLIHNAAAVLREKDIITEAGATTPARRIYFAIQCKYLFPGKDATYLPLIYQFIEEFETAAPSTAAITREVRRHVDEGALYQALKSAKQLISREQEILNGFPGKPLPDANDAAAG